METCDLCRPDLWPCVTTSALWRLIVNYNQNLLGKCFWVLNRHEEHVADLTVAEWAELHLLLAATTQAMQQLWQPDHYNYAFLQNQDRHVHLHIIPRYAAPRSFGGHTFTDQDYPNHYAVPSVSRRLAADDLEALTGVLRQQLATTMPRS